jgi:hypothetical protein
MPAHSPEAPARTFAVAYATLLVAVESTILYYVLSDFVDEIGRRGWTVALRYALPVSVLLVLWHKYASHLEMVGRRIGATGALVTFLVAGLQIGLLHWADSWTAVLLLLTADLGIAAAAYAVAGARWSEPYVMEAIERYFKGPRARGSLWYAILGFEARSARATALGFVALCALTALSKVLAGEGAGAVMAGLAAAGLVAFLLRPDARAFLARAGRDGRYEDYGRRIGRGATTPLRFLWSSLRTPWSQRKAAAAQVVLMSPPSMT